MNPDCYLTSFLLFLVPFDCPFKKKPKDPCTVCLPTFAIKINQMMWNIVFHAWILWEKNGGAVPACAFSTCTLVKGVVPVVSFPSRPCVDMWTWTWDEDWRYRYLPISINWIPSTTRRGPWGYQVTLFWWVWTGILLEGIQMVNPSWHVTYRGNLRYLDF